MSLYPASFDDNDPAIVYSGSGWELVTEDGQWRGTMHSTSVTGSWARVRFTGSRIAVICTIPTGDGSLSQARFQIDGRPAQYVSHRTTPPVQWQTTFWDSGPLSMGSHLLTITNAGNEAYFRMDRIDYDPTNSNAPLPRPETTDPPPGQTSAIPPATPPATRTVVVSRSETSGITSGTQSGSLGSTVPPASTDSGNNVTQGPMSTSTASSLMGSSTNLSNDANLNGLSSGNLDPSSSSKHGPSIPGILAGVFGGILFLVFIVSIVFFLRRRRQRQGKLSSFSIEGDDVPGEGSTVAPVPFLGRQGQDSESGGASAFVTPEVEHSPTQPSMTLSPLSTAGFLLPQTKERLGSHPVTRESPSTTYAASSGFTVGTSEAGDVDGYEYQSTTSPSGVSSAASRQRNPLSLTVGSEFEAPPPAYDERVSHTAAPVIVSGDVKMRD